MIISNVKSFLISFEYNSDVDRSVLYNYFCVITNKTSITDFDFAVLRFEPKASKYSGCIIVSLILSSPEDIQIANIENMINNNPHPNLKLIDIKN